MGYEKDLGTAKLKEWMSELCSGVCGTNMARHEAWVSHSAPTVHEAQEGCLTEGGQRAG